MSFAKKSLIPFLLSNYFDNRFRRLYESTVLVFVFCLCSLKGLNSNVRYSGVENLPSKGFSIEITSEIPSRRAKGESLFMRVLLAFDKRYRYQLERAWELYQKLRLVLLRYALPNDVQPFLTQTSWLGKLKDDLICEV